MPILTLLLALGSVLGTAVLFVLALRLTAESARLLAEARAFRQLRPLRADIHTEAARTRAAVSSLRPRS